MDGIKYVIPQCHQNTKYPYRSRKKVKNIENSETQSLQIVIDQKPVWKVKYTKYLGVAVDKFLNWEENIPALIKQI